MKKTKIVPVELKNEDWGSNYSTKIDSVFEKCCSELEAGYDKVSIDVICSDKDNDPELFVDGFKQYLNERETKLERTKLEGAAWFAVIGGLFSSILVNQSPDLNIPTLIGVLGGAFFGYSGPMYFLKRDGINFHEHASKNIEFLPYEARGE